MGGDSASTNTPYENSLRGVPDIRFSDTSLPVFADQFQVVGTWNMPVTGLVPQTGGPVSAGIGATSVEWYNIDDTPLDLASQGEINITHFDGSNAMFFAMTFPKNRHGYVIVYVRQKSATSAVDNRTHGPPKTRLFRVEYDTRDIITPDLINDGEPAELVISAPYTQGTGTWKNLTYLQGFYFSKPVSEFAEEDITIEVAGNGTAVLSDFQQTQEDNKLYTALITLSGSGTYTIKVKEKSAKSGGSTEDNTPPSEVSESWAFDARDLSTAFEIAGVEIIHSETRDLDTTDPEGGNIKGSFLGISDFKLHDNRVYFTSQIQRRRANKNELSIGEPSNGALVSVHLPSKSKRVIKNYRFFRQAARSLVVHNNRLHFFEGSAYLYPDARLISTRAKIPLDRVGFVQRISDGQEVEQVGFNWRSSFPTGVADKYEGAHGGTFSPMISVNGDLHLQSAKTDILDINGYMWVVHSTKLNQRITLLETNGKTGFEIIEQLAVLSNSIIGFQGRTFIFKSRKPTQGYLNAELDVSHNGLALKQVNRILGIKPSGLVLVDDEIISYSGVSATGATLEDLTGLVRGLHNSAAKTHKENTPVVFLDSVINAIDLHRPVNDMDIVQDGTLIYNNILTQYANDQVPRVNYLSFPTPDEESILEYGDRKFKLELPLDFHQRQWAIKIAKDFVNSNKDLHSVITLTLKKDFDVELGDIIYLTEPVLSDTSLLCQVMSVNQLTDDEETEVIVKSISL